MARVYAIEGAGTGLIKLGRAIDPAKRLRELQVGSPVQLRLLASAPETLRRTESALHRTFASSRSHGEWFRLTDEDASAAVLGFGEFS